jgi:hypothetical protein
VKGIVWFPQSFGGFKYDALDAAQAQKVAEVSKRLATPWAPGAEAPTARGIERVVVEFSDGTSTTVEASASTSGARAT